MSSHALALHTSSSQLGLAVCEVAITASSSPMVPWGTGRQQTWDLGRGLLNDLHSLLQDWIQPLTWQDFVYLAVAQGPGSFTSTRIGLVTARTLGQQLALPVFTVSSLAAFAHDSWVHNLSTNARIQDATHDGKKAIAVELAASRGQVYGGLYQVQSSPWIPLQPDALYEAEEWSAYLNQRPGEILRYTAPEPLGYTVSSVLALAQQAWHRGERPDWSTALPFYGNEKIFPNIGSGSQNP